MFKYLLICIGLSFRFTFAQIVTVDSIAGGFYQPVIIATGHDGNLYVGQNAGKIIKIDLSGNIQNPVFLDLGSKVTGSNRMALQGLCFHPSFPATPYFYIKYVTGNTCYISRFAVDPANTNQGLISSETIILQYSNYGDPIWGGHQGGNLEFGPDGYLYFTTGDGAAGSRGQIGDENNVAQNLSSINGKMIRIDIDNGLPAYPIANPYRGDNDNIPNEIIAFGLRNAWKFTFDKTTGDIWIGDVGQDSYEEVNFVPNGTLENRNFGWSCKEGFLDIKPQNCNPGSNLTDPIYAYQGYSFNGNKSACVVGGYVYRGLINPNLAGKYIFADFNTSEFWMISDQNNSNITALGTLVNSPVTFGQDDNGELYVASFSKGVIYRIKQSCTENLSLSDSPTNSFQYFVKKGIISTSKINAGLGIQYSAGENILLNPGFNAEKGAIFKAQMGGCQ